MDFLTESTTNVPLQHRFDPYTQNGGSILAIAGEDFVVVAGDTRMTDGQYGINTRYAPKVWDVGNDIVFTANGFSADCETLVKRIAQKIEWYHHAHNRKIKISSLARLTQTMLYGKRFFPYYASTIIGGIDADGKGVLYGFDSVGSYEQLQCRAGGAAAALIMPFLDSQVDFKNQYLANGEKHPVTKLPVERVINLVKDSFAAATERHIEVGDGLEIYVVDKSGVRSERWELKKD